MKAITLTLSFTLLALVGCAGGPLTAAVRSDITRQMVAQRPALSRCYGLALTRDRQAIGRMTLNFTVTPAGSFAGLTIASSAISDGKLSSCVENTLQNMTVQALPDRPVLVTYPVDFSPEAIP